MACNGFNHAKDCKCNFRGGHPNSRPPTWRGWRPRAVRRYTSGPNAKCPECRAAIYYVPGPRGGGAYFDSFGPPWPKHACTNKPRPYSPYGRTGKPKLRNRKSHFEKGGWLPFFIRNVERLGVGTIIHGVALDDPTVLHFGCLDLDINPDRSRPVYFRKQANDSMIVDLNFFIPEAYEPTSRSLHDNCVSELELLLRETRP